MSSRIALAAALADLESNPEQTLAVNETGHCVVLAGPGSGKTKTLTTAMARALLEDVIDPRGVACITYNNECALELEERLAKFGIESSDRNFIGTVHSFALTQVIVPYARCLPGLLLDEIRVANKAEKDTAIAAAYDQVFGDADDLQERWLYAEQKRKSEVDRSLPNWRGSNPELADFVEAYEAELRRHGLIDFEDMPLIAFRMVKDHPWMREAIQARFPVLFVDEYQDLGHALHELVKLLCFTGGVRLFAVGDVDQSIYGFTGADPSLLESLTQRIDVTTKRLRFNYRSGAKIIRASLGALGEERDYRGIEDAPEGELRFVPVDGNHVAQAKRIAEEVVPRLVGSGYQSDEIAILYRAAWLGDKVAAALDAQGFAYVRADTNALVRRNSPLARLIEACAAWVAGGWRDADPPYNRLLRQALAIVFGVRTSSNEQEVLSLQLIEFLRKSIGSGETAHAWLLRFRSELILPWQAIARNSHQEWEVCSELADRTDPLKGHDMPLATFAGRIEGTGRITLSTFHSSKGREFDVVILMGINDYDLPNQRDRRNAHALREARRLFYVGVTRPRKELYLVYERNRHSPWVKELSDRSRQV